MTQIVYSIALLMAMVNYLLVISFVFRLMDEPTWNNHTLVGREHPPGPMRFQVVCLHIVEHFQRAGNKDGENRVTRAMQEIWEIGEILFAKTLDRKPNPDIKRLTMSEETERHYNQISDRAANLPKHLFGLAHNL